jgi:hypothetical protein
MSYIVNTSQGFRNEGEIVLRRADFTNSEILLIAVENKNREAGATLCSSFLALLARIG